MPVFFITLLWASSSWYDSQLIDTRHKNNNVRYFQRATLTKLVNRKLSKVNLCNQFVTITSYVAVTPRQLIKNPLPERYKGCETRKHYSKTNVMCTSVELAYSEQPLTSQDLSLSYSHSSPNPSHSVINECFNLTKFLKIDVLPVL